MSDNYSFRLCPTRKRERQARLVLVQWQEEGFTIRHIITEALLALDESRRASPHQTLREMQQMVTALSSVVEHLQTGTFTAAPTQVEAGPKLSDDLTHSLLKNRKRARK